MNENYTINSENECDYSLDKHYHAEFECFMHTRGNVITSICFEDKNHLTQCKKCKRTMYLTDGDGKECSYLDKKGNHNHFLYYCFRHDIYHWACRYDENSKKYIMCSCLENGGYPAVRCIAKLYIELVE